MGRSSQRPSCEIPLFALLLRYPIEAARTFCLPSTGEQTAERDVGSERLDLDDRIDHVFVSPGTRVLRAEYRRAGASDHPVLCAEIGN